MRNIIRRRQSRGFTPEVGKVTTELCFHHEEETLMGIAQYNGYVDLKVGERITRKWHDGDNPINLEYVVAKKESIIAVDRPGEKELIFRYELQQIKDRGTQE